MPHDQEWRHIVASALDWQQAHASFDSAIKDLAAHGRGKRPSNFPHSVWELVDHIRRTQHDLLEFCRNDDYEEPKWPDDYWPSAPAPESDRVWNECIAAVHVDTRALAEFTMSTGRDLTSRIPHGTGQTYL